MDNLLFEFRAFAQNFGIVETKIRKLFELKSIEESEEIYIVSDFANQENVKIRDGRIEIKELVSEEKRFEKWKPGYSAEFPVIKKTAFEKLNKALSVNLTSEKNKLNLEEMLEAFNSNNEIKLAKVFKRRFKFSGKDCYAEYVDVFVNGALIKSVSLESENLIAAVGQLKNLFLNDYENVNYVLAIKRILGMEPLP